MGSNHTVFVCTTCASVWKDGQRVGQSRGEQLLATLNQAHQHWDLQGEVALQAVTCMSSCNRPCSVAFAAPGKHTYLFGDIAPEGQDLDEMSQAILDCAALYYQKPDGLMGWSERPERLKSGIVARIPPFPTSNSN